MKIFVIIKSDIIEGVWVQTYTLRSGQAQFPAILVGEQGRGRSLGILPVTLLPHNYAAWEAGNAVKLKYARIGQTQSGKPKLIEMEGDGADASGHLLVIKSPIGFRGSNYHEFPEEVKIIVEGEIAQGAAGRMGSGSQYVVVAPFGATFTLTLSGRLYGAPSKYIYHVTPEGVQALTGEEAELL